MSTGWTRTRRMVLRERFCEDPELRENAKILLEGFDEYEIQQR